VDRSAKIRRPQVGEDHPVAFLGPSDP
jgi:hypothetical protein